SSGTRNSHMSDLIDRGFDVIGQTPVAPPPAPPSTPAPSANLIAASAPTWPDAPSGPQAWALQIDGFDSPAEAAIMSETLARVFGRGVSGSRRSLRDGRLSHSIRVDALDQATARTLCAHHGELLGIAPRRCKVLSIVKSG
ncbi:MAG: hypothetical protein AAF311_05125, partial [Pseudomonadota bacterium]